MVLIIFFKKRKEWIKRLYDDNLSVHFIEKKMLAIKIMVFRYYFPFLLNKFQCLMKTLVREWKIWVINPNLVISILSLLYFLEPITSMGNAFVACGVIYTIDHYDNRFTTINFAYDTKTGRQWNPNIKFINQYGYNSMVDYNPWEKVLYAWDNRFQVTYPITFEEH